MTTATLEKVRHEPLPGAAWAAFAVVCLLWGTTFLGIRIAIETIPTLLVPPMRFLGAGTILLLAGAATGARFPRTPREWIHQGIAGILMAGIGNTSVVWAEQSISSGMAALLAAMIPIWMSVMEWVIGESRLTPRRITGLCLGFGGVALLVAPEIGSPHVTLKWFAAVGAMQLSAIAWNWGTLYSRKHRATGDAMTIAGIQMLAGGAAVGVLALLTGAHHGTAFSLRSLGAVLYLMIFGSIVAHTAFLYALSKLGPGRLSSYAYVNPAVAVVVGALILREPVSLRMVAAMAVILAGVGIIQLEKRLVR